MNTKQMSYLIETAKTLNISRAAENLYISQPSLSYQIKTIEEEVGFAIFDRIGKSIHLTPAGQELITSLSRISLELQFAIEQAQNMGKQYQAAIKIGFSARTMLYYLPEAMNLFETMHPTVQIVPDILPPHEALTAFMRKELDLLLLPREEAEKLVGVRSYPLFTSQIYLLCQNDDPLAEKEEITANDLAHRTLLVNGGSSSLLRQVQQRVMATVPVITNNSPTHDYTLIQVASGKAICLSPGYLNDHSDQFSWVPFDCPEHFDYVLVSHQENQTPALAILIDILQNLYKNSQLNL
ncbi:LysR family transcriptional regulator [Streptococcus uberis]|uniref:LysR family transcriptional regulator n=1 Tax=Streptococcus uberis TaxID=1349 RepID=UPI001FF13ED2|nr:LysR family transcriptional regulator [Streptococcus uberis]MCK1160321.1 LysR family transcriptional regulator [Streptococcus uberis]MCK1162107.1 LysR family transcriptional regulator [Streptococcus uberis]MCK1168090.1 LysR family transcriptional regulator [Streptococcus uberis]MCK1187475.1 LysR family transcriptional regulator [Streptococcus uberis]MCK1240686.1 LysR family transcriptional regulator [Streptococcus uberis]